MNLFLNKNHNRIYYHALILISCLVLCIPPLQAKEGEPEIAPLKKEELKTIIVNNYYPYTYVNEHGDPDGFSIELAKAISRIMGRELKIEVDTWDRAKSALQKGEIDLLPMMAYSKKRDSLYDFSVPHTIAYDALFTRTDAAIKSVSELDGSKIIVMKNDQAHEYLMSLEDIDQENLILINSLPEALRRLSAGEGDVALMPKLVGLMVSMELNLSNLNKNPKVIEAYNRPFSFAVKEGNQVLLERLVQGLDIVKKSGRYDALYRKWFGTFEPKERSFKSVLVYILSGFLFLTAIGTAFALWSFSLRKQVALRTKKLAARESFLNSVIEQSPFAIWISDAEGTLQRANPALKAFLNLTDKQLVGKYNVLRDPLVERQGLLPLIRTVYEGGKTVSFTCEWDGNDIPTMDLKGSSSVTIEATMFPILNMEGELTNVVLNWVDITKRKEAEEEIRELNLDLELRVRQRTEQLEDANKELENFVYSVSHDLRAPLRSIGGFAEIIRRRHRASLNEEGLHYFDNIIKASKQMGMMIDDLLNFSRLGRQAIKFDNVLLDDVLKTSMETLSDHIKETNAQIKFPDRMPVIRGDLKMVNHIFINLLENAIKYHRPNLPPLIEIWSEVDDRHVVVSIADNGIGIEPEYHDKVFKMFQRLHGQTDYPGTGIGLAAVKKAVLMIGGEVWVESKPDKGSVFKLKLLKSLKA